MSKTACPIFEDSFVTAHQDRYELMCGLHAYNKINDKSTDATSLDGTRPLPQYYKIGSLIYLCVSFNFINTWLKVSANNTAWRFYAYQYMMKYLFVKTPKKNHPNS